MKFLVTGCAGFIGGHMLELLAEKGIPAVGVDDFSTGKRENLERAKGKFDLIEGDLCDPAIAEAAVRGVTHVVHLASIPSVPRSIDNPRENMLSSVASTVSLFEAARKAGVRRIVQASSSAVYGDNPVVPSTEEMLPRPLSPYAAAKLAQESYGRAFYISHGIDSVAFRYFNVFGPRQDPKSEYAAVIPKFITLMLAGKQPTIFGDGGQTRDFIYVGSVVAGNLAAALYGPDLKGAVINLANGFSIDLNQLVARINRALGSSLKAQYAAPRSGEVRNSAAGTDKAREVLGYTPVVDFDEGLRRTITYFKDGGK